MLKSSKMTLDDIRAEMKAPIWNAYNGPICEWIQENLHILEQQVHPLIMSLKEKPLDVTKECLDASIGVDILG